jgi:4-amino-4-deoxy-L-arabinose transferase-like glycosyltransferase
VQKSVIFLLLYAGLLVGLVLARPLLAIDETRYLAVAWEMHLSGDPFHLTRNFESYAHKPPLLFWLINLIWLATGVSEIAGRLVGPVCAIGALVATGWLARSLWPDRRGIGLAAMVATGSFPLFMVYGSATMFDALLSLVVVLGVGAIWRIGQGRSGVMHWAGLGLILGVGVLAKGPVVLVHLLPILVTMRLWAEEPPSLRSGLRGAGIALLVALGLVAVWLVPALATGDAAFRHELLWTQTVARVTGDLGHGRPFWFLLALVPLIVFPWGWSWRLWAALPGTVKRDRAALMCVVWVLGATAIFSVVGGKQMHYLLPELPGLGLVVARVLGPTWGRRGGSLAPLGLLGLALALAVAALGGADRHMGAGVVITPPEAWGLAAMCLALAVAGLVLTTGLAHAAMGLGLPLVLHLVIVIGGAGSRFETQPIADALAPRAGDGIAVFGIPYNADFNFKARMVVPVATPGDEAALAAWIRAHPDGWIIGPAERTGFEDAPIAEWTYRGRPLGLWSVKELASQP